MPCPIAMLLSGSLLLGDGAQESTAPPTMSPREYYQTGREARELERGGDIGEAAELYEELADHDPSNGETWLRLGRCHALLGDPEAARSAYVKALEHGRGGARVAYDIARCEAFADRPDEAFRWIDEALARRLEDRGRIAGDPALGPLRDDPRWAERAGVLPEREWDRVEGWRHDLRFLVSEARRMHAGPERPAHSAEFQRLAEELAAAVPELSDDEVRARMMHLVARLEDGHSALYGPDSDSELDFERRVLPFRLYEFPDGLYILAGDGDAARLAGCRIVRFGDVRSEEVLRRLSRFRGVDNAATWKWMGPQFYVRQMFLLCKVGAASTGDRVELTIADRDGEESTVTVESGHFDLVRKLRPSPAATGPVPLYQSRIDDQYWMQPLPDDGALYVQFNQVRDRAQENLARFSERLREELAGSGARALIVDVRHNNGGNNSLVRPLIRTMIHFELADPGNRIFVLMGRNTFSAAQNFLNRVERWTNAEFVGEPSSSSPNFVGEETEVVLPYSRIRGSISTRYWQDSDPGDDRPWIAPDVPVALTAEDYFDGVDPALEAVLDILADDRRP